MGGVIKWLGEFDSCLVPNSRDDFWLKYGECFVFVNTPCGKKLSLIKDTQSDNVTLETLEGYRIKLNYNTQYSLEARYPEVGFFNNSENVCYVAFKTGERKAKRAPSVGMLYIQELSQFLRGQASLVPSLKHLSCIFNRKNISIKEGVEILSKKRDFGIALSPKLALSKTTKKEPDKYYLWAYNAPIGLIDTQEKTILVGLEEQINGVKTIIKGFDDDGTWKIIV